MSKTLLIAIFILVLPGAGLAWPAQVQYVIDGDTVVVINRRTGQSVHVRLAGIAAPEVDHGCGGQPYGPRSKQMLARLLQAGRVAVNPNGTYSYGRIVGTITSAGVDVGQLLVAAGMAWNYPQYSPDYSTMQHRARSHDRGLWQQPNPIAPWDWRHHYCSD